MKKSASRLREMLQAQLDSGQANVYFVLKRGEWETLQRYPAAEIDRAVADVTGCDYIGIRMEIPYFERQEKSSANKTHR